MKKILNQTVLAGLMSLALSGGAYAQYQVFGYYDNWNTYGKNFQPSQIPVQYITAGIYAFAQVGNCARDITSGIFSDDSNPMECNANLKAGITGVQNFTLNSTDPWSDFSTGGGLNNMGKFINVLHAQKKNALLSISGFTLTDPLTLAMSPTSTTVPGGSATANIRDDVFIPSIINFLKNVKAQNNGDGFDGVDVDWEPNDGHWTFLNDSPATANEILTNYLTFLQNLKTQLQQQYAPYAWVTIAAPANPEIIAQAEAVYDSQNPGKSFWGQVGQAVDYVDVMAYDYHGSFDNPPITNYLAALTYDPNQPTEVSGAQTFNVTSTINAYKAASLPLNKLVLGAPTYGRAEVGVANNNAPNEPNTPGLYQSFSATAPGDPQDGPGVYDYCDILAFSGFTTYSMAGFETAAYNPSDPFNSGKNGAFVSYDSPSDITAKANLVKQQGLGGMMFWDLSGDTRTGDVGYPQNSLIYTAYTNLNGSN